MDKLLKRAIAIATKYHRGQVDKGGYPYIDHPLRVMEEVKTIEEKILAVLHDVLEDCNVSRSVLIQEGIPEYLVIQLEILCKANDEDYFDYINRVKIDQLTTNVKLADLKDNMNLKRLKCIYEEDLKRLEKYKKAKEILETE